MVGAQELGEYVNVLIIQKVFEFAFLLKSMLMNLKMICVILIARAIVVPKRTLGEGFIEEVSHELDRP